MSLAIAYAMRKKKKCHGGEMAHGGYEDGGKTIDEDPELKERTLREPERVRSGHRDHSMGVHKKAGHMNIIEHKGMLEDLREMKHKDRKYLAEGGPADDYGTMAKSVKDAFKYTEPKAEAATVPEPGSSPNLDSDKGKRMSDAFKNQLAKGGEVEEEMRSGYGSMPHPCENCGHVSHKEENQGEGEEEDMISRIMKKREKHYSHGGKVSNEDEPMADDEHAQYDDLEKDDDLHEHYTGKNSGDEDGDEQEDEDRHDIVSRIMKSRKKKDRLPHPA